MRSICFEVIGLCLALLLSGCNGSKGANSASDISGSDTKAVTETKEGDSGTAENRGTVQAEEVYADVTGVTISGEAGAYTFDVTVKSADTGCTQYADWWEVVSETGELLYRRILAHSHTEENGTGNPFTRSGGPVAVEADQTVVVRAHMNTVGYKGKIVSGTSALGFSEVTTLPKDFASDIEREEPQPTTCAF